LREKLKEFEHSLHISKVVKQTHQRAIAISEANRKEIRRVKKVLDKRLQTNESVLKQIEPRILSK